MAVTTGGIDKAEITRCVELDGRCQRVLPWVFVAFADTSEVHRYVMPASNGLHLPTAEPYRTTEEAMRNLPFPHELYAGPRSTTDAPGPQAVHFFGQTF